MFLIFRSNQAQSFDALRSSNLVSPWSFALSCSVHWPRIHSHIFVCPSDMFFFLILLYSWHPQVLPCLGTSVRWLLEESDQAQKGRWKGTVTWSLEQKRYVAPGGRCDCNPAKGCLAKWHGWKCARSSFQWTLLKNMWFCDVGCHCCWSDGPRFCCCALRCCSGQFQR